MRQAPVGSRDNAHDKDFTEIAQTFVEPSYFVDALPWKNTVITGPRGSGKTTLLKMLAAQGTLARRGAGYAGPPAQFSGVYVPADPTWTRRTSQLPDQARLLLYKMLAVRSVLAVIGRLVAMQRNGFAVPMPIELTSEGEQELARELGRRLCGDPSCVTLRSVRDGVDALISRTITDGSDYLPNELDWLHATDVLAIVEAITGSLARHSSVAPNRWALLLDELELAPPEVFQSLWAQLRAPSDHWRAKLALLSSRPVAAVAQGEVAPKEGHDFDPLSLSWRYNRDHLEFSERLLLEVYDECSGEARGRSPLSAVIGQSQIGNVVSGRPTNSRDDLSAVIARLRDRDPSFREWADSHSLTQESAASHKLRNKTSHVVAIRDCYNREVEGGPRVRTPSAYAGSPTLLALTEGNPRLITWAAHGLCNARSDRPSISRTKQGDVIQRLIDRQVAVLSTIRPDDDLDAPSAFDLVKLMGEHFRKRSTEGTFRADPVTVAVLGESEDDVLLQLVELGIQFGGLVEIGDKNQSDASPRRIRLHNLMAAHFRLPIKIGKAHRVAGIDRIDVLLSGNDRSPDGEESASPGDEIAAQARLFGDTI